MDKIHKIKDSLPLEVVIGEVVELKGDRGLCPFHDDHNPSLTIKGDYWRCWACGVGGDVIDFVKKFHGISTKEAMQLLASRAGVSLKRPTSAQVAQADLKRALISEFREWEKEFLDELAMLLRVARQLLIVRGLKSWEEVEKWTDLIRDFSYYEYIYEILCGSNDQMKLDLYKQEMSLDD